MKVSAGTERGKSLKAHGFKFPTTSLGLAGGRVIKEERNMTSAKRRVVGTSRNRCLKTDRLLNSSRRPSTGVQTSGQDN